MLILFVFFVSFNMVMIRSDGPPRHLHQDDKDNMYKIRISKNGVEKKCNVSEEVKLVKHRLTLQIESEYFINKSFWHRDQISSVQFEHLPLANINMIYLKTNGHSGQLNETKSTINYTISYTYEADNKKFPEDPEKWFFTFEVLKNYDPWSFKNPDNWDIEQWTCNTSVKIDKGHYRHGPHGHPGNGEKGPPTHQPEGKGDDVKLWLIIVLSVIGALLVAQTTYIVWGKVRDRKSNKNSDKDPIAPKSPNVKRGSNSERNIADRPPLPLPPDEVIRQEPVPPLSPGPKRHPLYPSAPPMPMIQAENSYHCQSGPIPLNSYRNKGLDTSEEGVTSPVFARHMEAKQSYEEIRSPNFSRRHMGGPLVPKPSYKSNALENSVEDLRSPGFPRRHEGPLVPKPSYKSNALENSIEDLRSPGFPRRHEGPLVPKPSYKNNALENSVEELRSPNFGRRQAGPLVPKQSFKNNALGNTVEELRSPDCGRRHAGPLVPKKSYRNKALDNSVEELRSPEFGQRHEGPIVPKQSYKNKPLDDSDEEIRTPGFARRQIEAKLAQLPPKGVMPSKSFKQPRPLPRRTSSPPPPPEKPAFHPAHRPDPGPPLLPKKAALFPTPDACRAQDSRRFSDDEWQYEQLQPDSKYLNNCANNTPYS